LHKTSAARPPSNWKMYLEYNSTMDIVKGAGIYVNGLGEYSKRASDPLLQTL